MDELMRDIKNHTWQINYKMNKQELTEEDLLDIEVSCEALILEIREVMYERANS